jgi:beta-galactosidase
MHKQKMEHQMNWVGFLWLFVFALSIIGTPANSKTRSIESLNKAWTFHLGDVDGAQNPVFDDSKWRALNLPHDWSIEGEFSKDNPATPGGAALPGGIGWYRKEFALFQSDEGEMVFIDFDGVYQNSEVWINGSYLGKRPYGYSSFRYDLTPYLHYGEGKNVIAVKVDNLRQPNSRWYSGSGIYRNVWLVKTEKVFVDHWGTFVTTPQVNEETATVSIKTSVRNSSANDRTITLETIIYNANGDKVSSVNSEKAIAKDSVGEIDQELVVGNPILWSLENPYLYKAVSLVKCEGRVCDDYQTTFGIRSFYFDREKGFFLNGKQTKILGVCNHHDLGCLGSAINSRALERQLEILKGMGCNAIRTSHNPPAPELLDLCDKMGFIVMDEAFDMWKKGKTKYDYHLHYDKWHKRDLEDFIRRDRNHPSVFIWSIGNEILEQWDKSGIEMAKDLAGIVKNLDGTRPVTSALNDPQPNNNIYKSGALDLVGFNYHHEDFFNFLDNFPGQKFIATETGSAIATRGSYDMPSDSVRVWPARWDRPTKMNPDFTCSAYDNCRVGWGSTHEETWRLIKNNDFLSGLFIWTGFDYLGEPTPYPWPARSSYFGIVDLEGFPKDAYYLYQSEWTDKPVLHIFPHWNWPQGKTVDVWAYTNFKQVELFLNGKSLGTKEKSPDELHLMWRVKYVPGTLKAVARNEDGASMTKEIHTAGEAAAIQLQADRTEVKADGLDLAFITVKVVDQNGVLVPHADNLIRFEISGEGFIAGVDNGHQISHEPFKANYRKAFNGMCLAVVQATEKPGRISFTAKSEGLDSASLEIRAK